MTSPCVGIDARESFEEVIERHVKILRDARDLLIVHSHIARPAAAAAAALAEVIRSRHERGGKRLATQRADRHNAGVLNKIKSPISSLA